MGMEKVVFLVLIAISMLPSIAMAEEIHDVAVTNIWAPSSATAGDMVTIWVELENQGTVNETVTVVLKDTTDDVVIDTKIVYVPAGELNVSYTYVDFSWNTTGASIGDHILEATAEPVPGETDTADNAMTATITIEEPAVYDGHISSLTTDQPKYTKGQTVYATAVVENTGNQVLNATVRFTYITPDQGVAHTEDTAVSVPVGSSTNTQSSYTLPRNAPRGTWTVKAELIYDGQILDTKTTTFEVVKRL